MVSRKYVIHLNHAEGYAELEVLDWIECDQPKVGLTLSQCMQESFPHNSKQIVIPIS